ncbi:MAG: hypothetical protein JWP38_3768 [Herbaspirillum sp.]|nr:hypothetical protein [Herbaspirillum sp.]
MYSQIKRLRRSGKRLSDDDIGRDPGVLGELRSFRDPATGLTRVGVFEWGNPTMKQLIPAILNPVVAGVGSGVMRLEGLERIDGDTEYAQTVMQEWIVRWMDRPKTGEAR